MTGTAIKTHSPQDYLHAAQQISIEVAAAYADEVDSAGRFPGETIDALKAAGLLTAGLPASTQGACNIALQSAVCFELAKSCASSAMILAMHFIQLDCLSHHKGNSSQIRDYLSTAAKEQRLIASATSEVGTDGDLRRSIAGIESTSNGFSLTKQATTISYGQYANDFLISARTSQVSTESDQRLVLALGSGTELETRGEWDTLGMRGTVSPGGTVISQGDAWQILETPFAEIAAVSMVPLSHLLWGACWLGLAHNAVFRTRQAVQKKARRDPESARLAAQRLATVHARYRQLSAEHAEALDAYTGLLGGPDERTLTSMGEAIRFNDLKLSLSEGIANIVQQSIQAAGISAYRNGSELSLGRHLRDALSAPLMINNDRIRAATADMQLVFKDK